MTRYKLVPWAFGYRVGSDGSVWVRRKRGQRKWNRVSQYRRPYGARYVVVCIRKYVHSTVSCHYVHRLVLELFSGPCPKGFVTAHRDGDTANNRISNLRWASQKDNARDKIKHGTYRHGERHQRAKLTRRNIIDIFRLRQNGWAQQRLANRFGVHQRHISEILRRKTWKRTIAECVLFGEIKL